MKSLDTWKFGIQVFFSSVVISLCVFKLVTSNPNDNQNVALYWGGLSGVLAYWLPSPARTQDESELPKVTTESAVIGAMNGQGNLGQSQPSIVATKTTTEPQD